MLIAGTYTAFAGMRCLASGTLRDVAKAVKARVDVGEAEPILIFDDATSQTVELDLRGSADAVLARLIDPEPESKIDTPRAPGRPKLGVVAREITLLPRHWEWLNMQPGGASITLRKLVDAARAANGGRDRARQAQEATQRFLGAIAGDLPGYEEATRALYAGDHVRFDGWTRYWPQDVRNRARKLAALAFAAMGGAASSL